MHKVPGLSDSACFTLPSEPFSLYFWFLRVIEERETMSILVRKRTLPIERLPLVGDLVANFAGRGMSRG
jgi:hypothetical protein